MQSIEARKEYKNSFTCAAKIFKDEGIFTFWSGAVPRLARLVLSGGIVFTMYVNPISKSGFSSLMLAGTRRRWRHSIDWIRNDSIFDKTSSYTIGYCLMSVVI